MFSSIGIPHGFCFLWNPGLLWLHVVSDSLIAVAYFLIPLVLLRIVHVRKDIPYNGVLLCFGTFIVACGITHILEVVTLWHPVYWISGTMKAVTAAISLTTFVVLLRLAPAIIALPSGRHLEEVNQQLSSVLECMTACVFAVDSDWKIIYLNGNARERLNRNGDVLGKTMFEAFPNQQAHTVALLRQAMGTRRPVRFDSFYAPLDLYSRASASPWTNGGLTIFFDDVSEQKRLERELDLERALREQRMEALAHMAGGLAHELSNPLGIIHARASDLAEMTSEPDPISTGTIVAACSSIVKTTDRAMRVLRGLRMFAQESTREQIRSTNVSELLQQAIDLVEYRFERHGIALEVSSAPPGLKLLCREGQIGQVILNLLNNAFDAVESSLSSGRWVKVSLAFTDDHVMMDVSDGGPGVPPEHCAYLMDPIFAQKPVGPGIGVGLSLSQAVAHDHGGSLVLVGDSLHTLFRLTLPRRPQQRKGAS